MPGNYKRYSRDPELAKLEFEAPRFEDFPALHLARKAGIEGGTLPAVFNAANEVAVAGFLQDRLSFLEIFAMVERAVNEHTPRPLTDLSEVLALDRETRQRLQA